MNTKRCIAVLVIVVLSALAGAFSATPALAQSLLGSTPKLQMFYMVKDGDDVWMFPRELLSSPYKYQELVQRSPFLAQPYRRFEYDGKLIVVLRQGEVLGQIQWLFEQGAEQLSIAQGGGFAYNSVPPMPTAPLDDTIPLVCLAGFVLIGLGVSSWVSRRPKEPRSAPGAPSAS
jgi:hypothetical protein